MIFPKGSVIYENLNTSFTNFEELLIDLKTNQITGYMLVSFWDYEGVLFLDSGNIINAVGETENGRKSGQDAINDLLFKSNEKDGTISVYSLEPDLVMMLAGAADGEIIYKELTNDFTNIEKLIDKLKTEQHTGYIEILTKNRKSTAIIFIRGGEPIESIFSTESKTISESGIHSEIYELVKSNSAIFNVYKTELNATTGNIITTIHFSQLLNFWGEVIAAVEKKFEPATFNAAFKNTLINKADDYPFLDPFAAEFSYADGKITFESNPTTNFSNGIAEVLYDVISQISDTDIKTEITKIMNSHQETIEIFSLEKILNNIITQQAAIKN